MRTRKNTKIKRIAQGSSNQSNPLRYSSKINQCFFLARNPSWTEETLSVPNRHPGRNLLSKSRISMTMMTMKKRRRI